MNVKLDIDLAECIFKAHVRRSKEQRRIYGLFLGTLEGNSTYHVKNIIYGFIFESDDISSEINVSYSVNLLA